MKENNKIQAVNSVNLSWFQYGQMMIVSVNICLLFRVDYIWELLVIKKIPTKIVGQMLKITESCQLCKIPLVLQTYPALFSKYPAKFLT